MREHFESFESYIPVSLVEPRNFLLACAVVYFFIAFRYFLMVGMAYFVLWKRTPRFFKLRQIYPKLPGKEQVWREIRWSLLTSVVFAVSGVGLGLMWELGWARFYLPFEQYGFWYLPLSLLLLSFGHELYFYWTHRWMHHPKVYRWIHRVHHESLEPSPWASFSFHPLESVLEALILPLLVLVVPVHPVLFLTYLTLMTVSAIVNHLGFEVLPRGALGQWLGRHFITGSHHSAHHRYFTCNYGLYYTWLDRLFRTQR